ncbi:MAG: hypothetical protein JKP98_12260 [Rhodobacteraceae bacterium]|nr:hypothetical protein [Paracoccaceae bacterium]
MLAETTFDGDQRLAQADRQIEALREQIVEERDRLANNQQRGRFTGSVIGEYETLLVDLEFAQQAYVSAAAAMTVLWPRRAAAAAIWRRIFPRPWPKARNTPGVCCSSWRPLAGFCCSG